MVIAEVVLETYDVLGFTAWPIAEPSGDHRLVLSGDMPLDEVATAMAVIFSYNRMPVEPIGELTARHLDEHLAEAECLIAPGGLRFRDTARNVEVEPGCCCGLENWRDWWDVVRGEEPWLGHDPAPRVEHAGQVVRLHQDDQDGSPAIEMTVDELQGLLVAVQRRLSGFLELAARWTAVTAPGLDGTLVAALDEHLRINHPS
jgi:hypothetical protein